MSKDIRRVVTGHDSDGTAVFRSDEKFAVKPVPSGDAAMVTLWTTATVPADLNDETDGMLRPAGTTLNGGSVIRICDMFPGQQSPMHRTNSIDYGVVIEGEIELELDNGVTKRLGAGSVIVQRGTIHLWRNPSQTQTCRIVFILIEAPAYLHEGLPLDELKPH
jgi:quercetin dioxygenase-like cupin family protein